MVSRAGTNRSCVVGFGICASASVLLKCSIYSQVISCGFSTNLHFNESHLYSSQFDRALKLEVIFLYIK